MHLSKSSHQQSRVSSEEQTRIAVVGLGYVGLPLLIEFGKNMTEPVIGFDVSEKRIQELKQGIDKNCEVSKDTLASAHILFSSDPNILRSANFVIVAVPTPIDAANQPDLEMIKSASRIVGKNLSSGTVVVFESTVYPGVTEEICVPIIEAESGLSCGIDWKIGYSPERINPGDNEHTIDKIVKVVSGCDADALERIASVYERVCKLGVHKASTIKTAEAAKVIENIQRDLNIALMNELSIIFGKLGIQTKDVLDAAGTKWNFHKYQPGLVGGHCIGVDPYYLVHKAEEIGIHPEVISAGRRINDKMAGYVGDLAIQSLIEAGKNVQGARVLVMGLTFKEDVNDTRNSKIYDTIQRLKSFGVHVLGFDPNLSEDEVAKFGVEYVKDLQTIEKVNAVILATLHKSFKEIHLADIIRVCQEDQKAVLIDLKSWFLKSVREQKEALIYRCL